MDSGTLNLLLIGLLLFFAFGTGFPKWLKATDRREWLRGYLEGLSTEFVGAIVTAFLFGIILANSQNQEVLEQQVEQEFHTVIADIRYGENPTVQAAVDRARAEEWLFNDSFNGQDFRDAELQEANLTDAVMVRADLESANLMGTFLTRANLTDADLKWAELQGAWLDEANLQNAELNNANLSGAHDVTLEQLQSAKTLQGAILPDGVGLPDDETWQAHFDDWSNEVALDENGHIIPSGEQ